MFDAGVALVGIGLGASDAGGLVGAWAGVGGRDGVVGTLACGTCSYFAVPYGPQRNQNKKPGASCSVSCASLVVLTEWVPTHRARSHACMLGRARHGGRAGFF